MAPQPQPPDPPPGRKKEENKPPNKPVKLVSESEEDTETDDETTATETETEDGSDLGDTPPGSRPHTPPQSRPHPTKPTIPPAAQESSKESISTILRNSPSRLPSGQASASRSHGSPDITAKSSLAQQSPPSSKSEQVVRPNFVEEFGDRHTEVRRDAAIAAATRKRTGEKAGVDPPLSKEGTDAEETETSGDDTPNGSDAGKASRPITKKGQESIVRGKPANDTKERKMETSEEETSEEDTETETSDAGGTGGKGDKTAGAPGRKAKVPTTSEEEDDEHPPSKPADASTSDRGGARSLATPASQTNPARRTNAQPRSTAPNRARPNANSTSGPATARPPPNLNQNQRHNLPRYDRSDTCSQCGTCTCCPGCASGCQGCFQGVWYWSGWDYIRRHIPWPLALSMVVFMIALGLTGPMMGIYFVEVDGVKFGGLGFCDDSGKCTTKILYSNPSLELDGYSWVPAYALPALLLSFSIFGGISALLLAYLLFQTFCVQSACRQDCCAYDPEAQRQRRAQSMDPIWNAQKNLDRFHLIMDLTLFVVIVLSCSVMTWNGGIPDDTPLLGEQLWELLIGLSAGWALVRIIYGNEPPVPSGSSGMRMRNGAQQFGTNPRSRNRAAASRPNARRRR